MIRLRNKARIPPLATPTKDVARHFRLFVAAGCLLVPHHAIEREHVATGGSTSEPLFHTRSRRRLWTMPTKQLYVSDMQSPSRTATIVLAVGFGICCQTPWHGK